MNTRRTRQLWNDFREPMWRFVRARVATDADADDVVQEVFLKVHSRSGQLRDDERVAGWIFSIASNALTDHYRERRPVTEPPPKPETPRPLEVDEEALLAQCVRPFIEQLPEIYRDALVMTELEGLTQADAADRAGISLSGMKSRVQRGREKLRESFELCCDITLDARNGIADVTPRCDAKF